MSESPLFSARDPSAQAARRRSAPEVEVVSDLRRFRGVGIAAVIGAVATVVAVFLWVDPPALRSPGPLSLPHRQAELSCASCHDPGPPKAACVGCHGDHPTTRAGHRAMREAGKMTCTTCHRPHADLGGVILAADGTAARFGPGAEVDVPGVELPVGVGPAIVPVVPVSACAGCHDPDRDADPLARCVLGGHAELGPERPTVCFDEHRAPTSALVEEDPVLRRRVAVWAAVRRVLAKTPRAPKRAPDRGGWLPILALGVGLSGLTFSAVRLVDRVRARRRVRPPLPDAAVRPAERRRLPAIDTSTCIGCYACVDACPYDVLDVQDYVARVVRPDDCCGLTLCEQRCPNGSLRITEGEAIGDRPRIDTSLQSLDTPGVWVAGDLTGLSLIRNAIHQGTQCVEAVGADLRRSAPDPHADLDLAIVGAGPAGLAAALAAQAAGLRYLVLEQGSVAESIRSFPRGKLVFDQPLGLPLVGELWLRESTKEELLSKWMRIVRERRLPIVEGTRITGLTPTGTGSFLVRGQTEGGPTEIRARRVVLAVGKRGTPRKLPVPIPEAAIDRVHYHLADARSLQGKRVVVVGLGDVAMEAALALARQPGTTVTLVHRGEGFSRGKARNVQEVQRLAAAGRIELLLGTRVAEVGPQKVRLQQPEGELARSFDALFVLIGAIAPWDFLAAVGVHRAQAPEAASARRLTVLA
jgi:thioredoxin reductase/NAD-dependent dihydropyrimidine dehydrogenase PreA subunit